MSPAQAREWLLDNGFKDAVVDPFDDGESLADIRADLWGFHWIHSDSDAETRALFEEAERRLLDLLERPRAVTKRNVSPHLPADPGGGRLPPLRRVNAMVLGPRDRKVIDSFTEKRADESKKLRTDGRRLDGIWMGGTGIASWESGKIVFHDLGSRSAQTVQRAIRKIAPSGWLKSNSPTPQFTVEAGRQILRDGRPFLSVRREGDTRPIEADEVTHQIAALLSGRRPRTVARGSYTVSAGRQIDRDGRPFISIDREGDTRPVEADEVTHRIVDLLGGRHDPLTGPAVGQKGRGHLHKYECNQRKGGLVTNPVDVEKIIIVNPSEALDAGGRSFATKGRLWLFTFGAYGDTRLAVWDGFRSGLDGALEMAAEYLADHAPGHLASDKDMDDLYKEAAEELGVAWPLPERGGPGDPEFDQNYRNLEKVRDQAEADMTYTESGWLTSHEWTVDEITRGTELFNAVFEKSIDEIEDLTIEDFSKATQIKHELGIATPWPTIEELAADLMKASKELSRMDLVGRDMLEESESADVRLRVFGDGWTLMVGDASYDPDHKGLWGAGTVPADGSMTRHEAEEQAADLIGQALEDDTDTD